MSIFVREITSSDRGELQDSRTTRSRVIQVVGTAGEVPNLEMALRVTDNSGTSSNGTRPPRVGSDLHPNNPSLLAVGYSGSPIEESGSRTGWQIVYDYMPIPIPGTDLGPPDETEVGFVGISDTVSSIFVDTWRTNVDTPIEVDNPLSTLDVKGKPVDSVGKPISTSLVVSTAEVTNIIAGTPPRSVYRLLSNKRNDKTFLAAQPGKLLYIGANTQRLSSTVYRVVHRFAWDDFFHLRQLPKLDRQTAKVILSDSSNPVTYGGVNYEDVALTVFHVQPYPLVADFGQLGLTV